MLDYLQAFSNNTNVMLELPFQYSRAPLKIHHFFSHKSNFDKLKRERKKRNVVNFISRKANSKLRRLA